MLRHHIRHAEYKAWLEAVGEADQSDLCILLCQRSIRNALHVVTGARTVVCAI